MTGKEIKKIIKDGIQEENPDMILFTLRENPQWKPSYKDNWLMRVSAGMGWTTLVAWLLADSRVDPTALGNDAIRWANFNGHTEVVELLKKHGCKIPKENDY